MQTIQRKTKRDAPRGASLSQPQGQILIAVSDVYRAKAFLALFGLVLDLLALLKGTKTVALNRALMDEDVVPTIFLFDKTETLGVIEPFYCAFSHVNHSPVDAVFVA
jgi:hypothetical protein